MDVISSAEFRKRYARLTEATYVTVNGHVIGVWLPGDRVGGDGLPRYKTPDEALAVTTLGGVRTSMTQADRDAVLRKINKG